MSERLLELYFHPLSSFCQKVLVALYENHTPFAGRIVDLGDSQSSAELKRIWPIGKFPVLRGDPRERPIPTASTKRETSCASPMASSITR